MKLCVIVVVLLQLCALTCCQDMPDYDVEDMFTGQPSLGVRCTQTASSNFDYDYNYDNTNVETSEDSSDSDSDSKSGSGSGSKGGSGSGSGGSGGLIPETEECGSPVSIEQPKLTEIEAVEKAACYAMCAQSILTEAGFSQTTLQSINYPGYPLWSLVTKSFILSENITHDCLEGNRVDNNGCNVNCLRFNSAYRKILDCERGCTRNLKQTSNRCDLECRNDCRRNGCNGAIFCFAAQVPPCGLDCNRGNCKTGCTIAANTFQSAHHPNAVPTEPPVVERVAGSSVIFYIDIAATTLPSVENLRLGYTTIIIKVEDPSEIMPAYFVLNEGFQFNLGGFLGQTVEISYAVVTEDYEVYPFSPTTQVTIGAEAVGRMFPGQLTAVEFTICENPDHFRYHNLWLSWNPPCNAEYIEGYKITLFSSSSLCGSFHSPLLSNKTNYLVTNTEPFDPNNIIAPITECFYDVTVTVLPVGPDSGNPVIFLIEIPRYLEPTSDDLSLECFSEINQETGRSYDLTVELVFSPSFIPVFIEQAINSFLLSVAVYKTGGSGFATGVIGDPFRLERENGTLPREHTFLQIPALELGQEYRIAASIIYQPNIPLGRLNQNFRISGTCSLREVGPISYCSPDPCVNGDCSENNGPGYTCDCVRGFTGDNCDVDIDMCIDDLCQNGGTCIEGIGIAFSCECLPGFSGAFCTTEVCQNNSCHNEGTCIQGSTSFTCDCTPFYTGTFCEIQMLCHPDIDPCVKGACTENSTGVFCLILEELFMNCPVGTYIGRLSSSGEEVCVQCPKNSVSTMTNSTQCDCLEGYYRTQLEGPNYDCTAPPSTCKDLKLVQERIRGDTLTVRWERPEITGRDDFYYNIFYSEDNLTFTQHNHRPYNKQDLLVDYSVSGLRPLTTYTVRVTPENGVSRREDGQRSCEVVGTTGDTRSDAPGRVLGLCRVVVWTPPFRSFGRITGYDIKLVIPGMADMTVSKGKRELFYVMGNRVQRSNAMVQVRAKTVTNGQWSDLVSLGCS